ncbi:hypothetical protein LEP1GSC179_0541 [Leptospira santarosai str. MOR084]|uniref:Uncharacterized protein n=1 Tax=Leptospira santarosai str. MOR084 TaxID=1049984 RepID=A0A0E2BA67_9LEPT|nr:hypothetical protein LEP1GSC179_0541 [Leptospira santarosai str. MOR084]
MPQESDQSATGLLDSVESRISHRTALCSRIILIYGSQRQVLGHAVKRISHWVIAAKRRFHAET